MTTFKWTVEIEVDALWIADGFNVTEYVKRSDGGPEALIDMGEAAKWFDFDEATIKVIASPDINALRKEQGFGPIEGDAK